MNADTVIVMLVILVIFLLFVGPKGCEGPNRVTDQQVKIMSQKCMSSDMRLIIYNDLIRSYVKCVKK